MAELDFDRTLPPKMPQRGVDFCDQVAALEAVANDRDELLGAMLVKSSVGKAYFQDIVVVEYPMGDTHG
jgi:hypothetical protein